MSPTRSTLSAWASRIPILIIACTVPLLLGSRVTAQVASQPLFSWQEALYGNQDNRLRWPLAVATADDNEFAVVDAFESKILLFQNKGGAVGWQVGAAAKLPSAPVGIAFDGERYLVSMRKPGSLLTVDRPQLRFRNLSLPAEAVPGALTAAPDGRVLVFDFASEAMLVVDSAGALVRSIPVDAFVTAVAIRSGSDFLVSTVNPSEIRRYSFSGELLGSWPVPGLGPTPPWPVGLVTRSGGEVVVVDRKSERILVLESGGQLAGTGSRRGWESGLLRQPSGLAILSDGRLVVADQGNGRIQIFRPAS